MKIALKKKKIEKRPIFARAFSLEVIYTEVQQEKSKQSLGMSMS